MSTSLNRVVIVGTLARDPELRGVPGGSGVCSLRIAVHDFVMECAATSGQPSCCAPST